MKRLFKPAEEYLGRGEDIALCVIVERTGSAPRGAGAAMLMSKDGRICGTIGGGAAEYRAQCIAKEAIKRRTSTSEHFSLKPNEVQDLGMVCGGDMTVSFRYISAEKEENRELLKYVGGLFNTEKELWMIIDIDSGDEGGIAFYSKEEGLKGSRIPQEVLKSLGRRPCIIRAQDRNYFVLQIQNMSRVFIFGGGHVSQALVPVLASVDFRCVILEDREEFCRPELFPGVESVKLIDNRKISDYISITDRDYVCIMTRGHKDDFEVQAQVLGAAPCYIGVIGSRSKKDSVFARLKERGFTDKDLLRITTPIGLEIKAETPAEIAISIAAQMIERRAVMEQSAQK